MVLSFKDIPSVLAAAEPGLKAEANSTLAPNTGTVGRFGTFGLGPRNLLLCCQPKL